MLLGEDCVAREHGGGVFRCRPFRHQPEPGAGDLRGLLAACAAREPGRRLALPEQLQTIGIAVDNPECDGGESRLARQVRRHRFRALENGVEDRDPRPFAGQNDNAARGEAGVVDSGKAARFEIPPQGGFHGRERLLFRQPRKPAMDAVRGQSHMTGNRRKQPAATGRIMAAPGRRAGPPPSRSLRRFGIQEILNDSARRENGASLPSLGGKDAIGRDQEWCERRGSAALTLHILWRTCRLVVGAKRVHPVRLLEPACKQTRTCQGRKQSVEG